MSERKTDRHAVPIAIRTAILLSIMVVLGAAAWLIGKDDLARYGTAPPAASVECDTCTLRHQNMARVRDLLKDEKRLNK